MPAGPGKGPGVVHVAGLYAPLQPQENLPYQSQDDWDWSVDDQYTSEPTPSGFQQGSPLPALTDNQDEIWAFFDDIADETDALDPAITDSAPVGATAPQPIQEEEYTLPFFWEGIEDSHEPDMEWSGPIQPNAPPMPVDDDWDWSDQGDYADDEFLLRDLEPLGPNSPAVTGTPPDDAWDWYNEDTENVPAPSGYQQQNAPPLPVEDGWDWTDQDDAADEEWLHRDTDSVPVTIPQPLPEDSWDHFNDDETDGWSIHFGNTDVPQIPEDGWDWSDNGADDDDWWLHHDTDPAPFSPKPPQPTEDDSVPILDEVEDSYETDWGLTDPVAPPANRTLAAEDSWPHDDEPEDIWDGQPDLTDPVGRNAPPPPTDEDYAPYADEVEDTWEPDWGLLDQSIANVPPLAAEDAWDHDDQFEDDWDKAWDLDQPVGPTAIVPPPAGFRVMAVREGYYLGILRLVNDVFDLVTANDYSSCTVSLVPPGNPIYPVYGWMQQVPQNTPLLQQIQSLYQAGIRTPPPRTTL